MGYTFKASAVKNTIGAFAFSLMCTHFSIRWMNRGKNIKAVGDALVQAKQDIIAQDLENALREVRIILYRE